jgi:hypothetical protein
MTMSKAEAARHKSQTDQILRLREDVSDTREQRDGYARKVKELEKLEKEIAVIVRERSALREAWRDAELGLARALGWIDCTMKVPPGGEIKSDIDFDDLCKEAIR